MEFLPGKGDAKGEAKGEATEEFHAERRRSIGVLVAKQLRKLDTMQCLGEPPELPDSGLFETC